MHDSLETQQVSDFNQVSVLQADLDPGEAEAIILAMELNAEFLLMDERPGRTIAWMLRFACSLGIQWEISTSDCYDERSRVGGIAMSLVISDDIIQVSGLSEREFLIEIVIMLFQQEKISLGKASELLEMHRMQFQRLLADRGICVHYDVAEFKEDLKTLQEMGW